MPPTSTDLSSSVRSELSGQFLVWEPVQRGPFSTAFTAHNARGGDRVLLHVVLRSALDRAGLTEQFHQAVTAAAALKHPGIVRVLASGSTASFEWYSTQPIEPRMRLSAILNERGPITGDELIALVQQTADVLLYAHRAGVPHGHLSPSTVFLNDEGRVCVSEFCTRRILYLLRGNQLRAAKRKGAADEVAAPEPLMRHDHLSLALLIHECLAGQALVTTGIESGATGPGAQIPLSDAFGDLEKRLRSRGVQPEGEARALNELFSSISDAHPSLPNVMYIAAHLGLNTRSEPEDEVRAAAVPRSDEITLDLQSESTFVFAGQPEAPKRHWSLIAMVAITVVVTWLALQTLPRVRPNTPDKPIVAVASGSALPSDSGNVRTELSSGSLAVAEAATAPQTTAPATKAITDPPKVAPPPARPDSQTARRTPADSATPRASRSGTVATQPPATKAVKTIPDSAKAAAQQAPGNLFISTYPWGYLYIDGTLIGNTPANDVSVSVGTHRLRVVRDGFQPYEAEITVLPGQRIRLVNIILSRENR